MTTSASFNPFNAVPIVEHFSVSARLSQCIRRIFSILMRSFPRGSPLKLKPHLRLSSQSRSNGRFPWLQRRGIVSAKDLDFGQPLHETHPHLLKPGELTPGISALEYATRRAALVDALPSNSAALVAAADLKYRSGSVFYRYHQDPNFLYLTGFLEPQALAVIEKDRNGKSSSFHLYVRPKSPREEMWEGSRSGLQAALDVFNADETGSIDEVGAWLATVLHGKRELFTDIPLVHHLQTQTNYREIPLAGGKHNGRNLQDIVQGLNIQPLQSLVINLRATKSDAEIRNLRYAGRASGRAFTEAMRHQFRSERSLENFLDYEFRFNGCEEAAYVPVVAGGHRANMIHYVRNDAELEDGQLVCVDAGGEYGGYVTDITRSWPINGKFTSAQKDLYEAILSVQRHVVSLCSTDAEMSLDKLHRVTENGLKDNLQQLGFDFTRYSIGELFPHHVGHHVGLSVHDAPGHTRTAQLRAGQCITVEPGIYVGFDERWPKHFQGMGIRIEDSVCIQDGDPLILTTEAVKEVVDIEALRR